jgi:hypothetical protein
MTKPLTMPWTEPVWTYLDITEFGLFVGATAKGTKGPTACYMLVPGTAKEPGFDPVKG